MKEQQAFYELADVSSLESRQQSLRDPKNIWIPAPSRFERCEQLMRDHHHGAVSIVSNRQADAPVCPGDFDGDGDLDGSDLARFAITQTGISLTVFGANFGKAICP